jgi:uncharacterized protein (TIGR03437 family)
MIKKLFGLACLVTGSVIAQTADTTMFIAALSTNNEIPAITAINASGTSTFYVHTMRDASGQITSGSIDFVANYNFPSQVTLTGWHIHTGDATVNGPVTINTGIGAGANSVDTTASGIGSIRRTANILPTDAAGLAALRGLFTDPAGYYVNMHTTVYAGGVIRGQLRRAESVTLLGTMSTKNEVPAINQNASGLIAVTAIRAFDANSRLVAGQVNFDVDYSFPAKVTLTGFHIHSSPAGVNGPVTINTGIGSGAASVATPDSGAGSLNFDVEVLPGNRAAADTLNGLFDDPNSYYANIHTTDFPGGMIRSQLYRTERTLFPISMSPANEVPAITGYDASALGNIDVRSIRDGSGNITAARVGFDVNYRFPGAAIFTGMHIHDAKAGVNGAVTINTGIAATAGNSVVSETGFGNLYRRALVSEGGALASLNDVMTNPENHYANLHTTTYAGGIVRAQLGANNTNAPVIVNVISSVSDPNVKTIGQGGLMTIFGNDLAKVPSDLTGLLTNKMPTSVGGTEVTIGGLRAPILMIGFVPNAKPAWYIVAQAPFETPTGPQQVVVKSSNGTSSAFSAPVAAVAPAVYFDGVSGIVFKADNFSQVRPDNPARAGDNLVVLATGLGQTTPALATGEIPGTVDTYITKAIATVTLGGKAALVIGSGALPGTPGTYLTLFKAAADTPAGNQPLVLKVGAATANTVSIPVK